MSSRAAQRHLGYEGFGPEYYRAMARRPVENWDGFLHDAYWATCERVSSEAQSLMDKAQRRAQWVAWAIRREAAAAHREGREPRLLARRI